MTYIKQLSQQLLSKMRQRKRHLASGVLAGMEAWPKAAVKTGTPFWKQGSFRNCIRKGLGLTQPVSTLLCVPKTHQYLKEWPILLNVVNH